MQEYEDWTRDTLMDIRAAVNKEGEREVEDELEQLEAEPGGTPVPFDSLEECEMFLCESRERYEVIRVMFSRNKIVKRIAKRVAHLERWCAHGRSVADR